MFKQESMYWLTGYDTFGFVFFQSLILKEDGEIILLTRAPDLRQAQNTSNIKNIKIWEDKEGSSPSDILKEILIDLNLKGKNIGIEYDSYGLTGRNTLKLNKSLSNFGNLKDKSELISYLRVIKSDEEIVYVRKAAELADNALDAVWKTAKSGIIEGKILAEMQKVVFEGGGDYPANDYIIGSGHNALLSRYQSEKRIFYFSKNLLRELKSFLNKQVIGSTKIINDFLITIDREFIVLTSDISKEDIYCEVEEGRAVDNDNFYFCWNYDKKPKNFSNNSNIEYVDATNFKSPLVLRSINRDDKFSPLGMNGTKKVNDYLTDNKISLIKKSEILAVCNDNDIIWVAGERINNNYRLTKNSKVIAKLNFLRK